MFHLNFMEHVIGFYMLDKTGNAFTIIQYTFHEGYNMSEENTPQEAQDTPKEELDPKDKISAYVFYVLLGIIILALIIAANINRRKVKQATDERAQEAEEIKD